ncbi:hypothetical protein [Devosia crocina]|uniref:hypothetical protein n=1 Tax=Devosia crocina TaxID=429728 RepID=UPI000B8820D0|nr:hypothetical protein [Devosia crocina]
MIEGLDPNLQAIGTFLFMTAVAIFTAYHYVFGKKPKPETKEFAVAGQLADMGPVKELIEQAGLQIQQQIRTNLHLEATAKEISRLADILEQQIEEARREKEIAEEVQRQLKDRG